MEQTLISNFLYKIMNKVWENTKSIFKFVDNKLKIIVSNKRGVSSKAITLEIDIVNSANETELLLLKFFQKK